MMPVTGYFPESKDHLIAVAARIEAECDAKMKFLLAEALAGERARWAIPTEDRPRALAVCDFPGLCRKLSVPAPK